MVFGVLTRLRSHDSRVKGWYGTVIAFVDMLVVSQGAKRVQKNLLSSHDRYEHPGHELHIH